MTPSAHKLMFLLLMILVLLTACDRQNHQTTPNIVATVGQASISTEEFVRSYQAGSFKLKQHDRPAQSFLDAMIAEELLAAELSKDSSYNSNVRLVKALRLLQQELVVERMFKTEVHDQVKVNDAEIRAAIEKSKLSIRAKFIICEDKQTASRYLEMLDSGSAFEDLAKTLVDEPSSQVIIDSVDYVREGELPEPLNTSLFNLKVYEYSDIIPLGNAYVIAHVQDRLQEIIDPKDYQKYHDRFYKILNYQKRLEKSRQFVKEFMDPLDIKVEGDVFALLVNALYDLYVNLPLEQQNLATPLPAEYEINPETIRNDLANHGDEIAVRSNWGDMPLKVLLEQLLLKPFHIEAQSKADFATELRLEIAITLRDYYLEQAGELRGFDQDRAIQTELENWAEKLMVQAFIENVSRSEMPDDAEMESYLQAHQLSLTPGSARWNQIQQHLARQRCKMVLDKTVDSLRATTSIKIFAAELNKLVLENPGQNNGVDTYLFKLGLPYLRSAFPTPDPIWGLRTQVESL